jgi:aromatic ring-opening dioxygenase catalytic subunit (LigB family)
VGKVVGGFATSHVLFSPKGVEEAAERILAGMLAIRAQVQALQPDVLVVISSDHLNNFTLRQQVTLAVGVAEQFTPLGDMGIPRTPFRGHRAFAQDFSRTASQAGFDLVQAEEVSPDHGIAITQLIADPDGRIPTVPVYINSNMPVPPTPARCFALGQILRSAIEEKRPDTERAVIIAGGGLSHWLRVPGQGRVAEAFDRHVLDMIVHGHAAELARISVGELEEQAGNGGLELMTWLCMAGAMPGRAKGEIAFFEPLSQWGTTMAGLSLHPAP